MEKATEGGADFHRPMGEAQTRPFLFARRFAQAACAAIAFLRPGYRVSTEAGVPPDGEILGKKRNRGMKSFVVILESEEKILCTR